VLDVEVVLELVASPEDEVAERAGEGVGHGISFCLVCWGASPAG
jgi:hypothetical protein